MFGLSDQVLSFTALTIPGIVIYNVLEHYTERFKVTLDDLLPKLEQAFIECKGSGYEAEVSALVCIIERKNFFVQYIQDGIPYRGKVVTVGIATLMCSFQAEFNFSSIGLILFVSVFPLLFILKMYLAKNYLLNQWKALHAAIHYHVR